MKIIVIGGGPGGAEVAERAVRDGHKVVVIERDRFGGTCTNRGCIPTKFLMSALIQEISRSGSVKDAAWKKIQARKKAMVNGLSRKIEKDLSSAGVEIKNGGGKLAGAGKVEFTDNNGARSILSGDVVVLATGSSPVLTPAFNVDRKSVLTSDEIMELKEIPRSIVIIGSGFIGSEYARIFNLLGSRVILIEALPRILPAEDDDTSEIVRQEFDRAGVTTVTGLEVSSVKAKSGGVTAELVDGRAFSAELALVSVGRSLETDDLGLEKAGITKGPAGEVPVNEFMETQAPGVYAVGDITGYFQLAHVAAAQGMVVAERLSGGWRKMDYKAVPWAIFVSPEVATVGLTERAAGEQGIDYVKGKTLMTGNIKARIDMEQKGFIKILAEPSTGRLLGGTIVGPRAADMIHILTVAMQTGLTAKEFSRIIYIHPTLSESFGDGGNQIASK